MYLSYLDTNSQLYVVIDPMFSNVEDYSNKIVGMFTNRNFASLFKKAYEQEYKLKRLVMNGYEYIKQKMEEG